MNREKNPANIYFYIPKIATPKGARDTDTVNKEVEYSSIWGGCITNGHREIYISIILYQTDGKDVKPVVCTQI